MHQISINLDKETLARIEKEALRTGRTKAVVIRDWLERGRLAALTDGLKQGGYVLGNFTVAVLVFSWGLGL